MANLLQKASIVLTPTAYDDGKVLCAKPSEPPYGDFDFSRNSAATRVNAQGLVENVQILSSNLVQNGDFSEEGAEEVSNGSFSQEGVELITNGNFDTDSDWTKLGSWTIENGKLTTTGGASLVYQNITSAINKTYKVVFEVSNYVSGEVTVGFGGALINPRGEYVNANGIYTQYLTKTDTNQSFGIKPNNFIGSIDNVSCVEVAQDWTLGTGWSIGEDKALSDGLGGNLDQSGTFLSGKTYKVVYTIKDYVSGDTRFRFTGTSNENGTLRNANGVYTEYIELTNNQAVLRFVGSGVLSITNISVKEVAQNWNLNGVDFSLGSVFFDNVNDNIFQNKPFTVGKKYRFSFSGSGNLSYRTGYAGADGTKKPITLPHTVDIVATSDTNRIQPYGAIDGSQGTLTSVVVKEVTDDTNLPRINYEGFSYQDALGSEEIVNGSFDTDSNWNKASGVTISDGKANAAFGSSGNILRQSLVTFDANKTYKYEFTISNYVSGNLKFASFIGAINESGNGTYVGYGKPNGTGVNNMILFGSFEGSIDNVSVKEYLGQEVVPDSGCGSWLFEPQSTNLITQSEDFSSYLSNATQELNSSISPSGILNASNVYPTTSGSTRGISTFVSGVAATEYTISIFAKSNGKNFVFCTNVSNSSYEVWFDLSNGTVSGNGASTAKITSYGNDWYKLSYTSTSTSTTIWSRFLISDTNGSTSVTANGTDGVYMWGAMLEQNSYATSYIPTSGSTVTRNQDVCTNGGSLASINSTEGVLYAEIASLSNEVASNYIALSDGTYNNRISLMYSVGTNIIRAFLRLGGASQADLSVFVSDITEFHKVAFKYKENDFALWIDGVEVRTDTSGSTIPSGTLTKLAFSEINTTGGLFRGKTKALAVWKEALSDEELTLLTAPAPVAPTFTLDFDTIATDFTFARGSEATYVDAQGLIQSTNEIGPELVINGDFATDSAWLKGTGWSISGGTANGNSPGSTKPISQIVNGLTAGKTYKVSFDLLNITSGYVRVYVYKGASGAFTNILATPESQNGTYEVEFEFGGTDKTFRIYPSSSADPDFIGSIDNVSVKEVITATNTPRLDYSTGAEAFLLEPQSTNLITYSEDFSNAAWVKQSGITITTNTTDTLSPSGLNNANKVVSTDSTKGFYTLPVSTTNDVTRTIYLKGSVGGESVVFKDGGGFGGSVAHTLTTEWVRYEFKTTNDGNSYKGFFIDDISVGTIYAWGAQLEEQSYATSYIPTSGTTVTRNQETCINATPEINSEEGTLYAEIAALANDGTNRAIAISDGSTSNVVRFYYSTTDNRIVGNVKSGGTTYFNFNNVLVSATDFIKVSVSYKINEFKMYVNGTLVFTDTSGNTPIGLNELSFDNGVGNDDFYGNTKDLQVFTEALSDYQLAQLTTI